MSDKVMNDEHKIDFNVFNINSRKERLIMKSPYLSETMDKFKRHELYERAKTEGVHPMGQNYWMHKLAEEASELATIAAAANVKWCCGHGRKSDEYLYGHLLGEIGDVMACLFNIKMLTEGKDREFSDTVNTQLSAIKTYKEWRMILRTLEHSSTEEGRKMDELFEKATELYEKALDNGEWEPFIAIGKELDAQGGKVYYE